MSGGYDGGMDARAQPWVILFDGTCKLCNGSVRFIIKRDKRQRFTFASAQSPEGQALAAACGLSGPTPGSMVLKIGDRCYLRSTAALQIARRLDGPWPVFFAFIVVPAGLRDWMYKLIATRRQKLFGKAEQCVNLPPARRASLAESGEKR